MLLKLPANRRHEVIGKKGGDAWRLAKDNINDWNKDWDNIKEGVMFRILKAKFDQNPQLKEKLLATKKAYLIEHKPPGHGNSEPYWSDDTNGTGKNRLGYVLMQLRGVYTNGAQGVVINLQALKNFIKSYKNIILR